MADFTITLTQEEIEDIIRSHFETAFDIEVIDYVPTPIKFTTRSA